MRGILRMLAVAAMCGSVAVVGGCSSDEGGAAAGDSSSPQATASSPQATASPQATRSLLTQAEVAAALGESDTGSGQRSVQICALSQLVRPPGRAWDAGTFYTLVRGEDSRETDVSECTITSADPQTIAQIYADFEGQTPVGGDRYAPAKVGVEGFAWELDGGQGAIDRFVVVTTGDALVGIMANRHSPVAEGHNLTREQVDNLVKAAVDKLAVAQTNKG